MDGLIDIGLLCQGFVPGGTGLGFIAPRSTGNRLDGLYCHIAFLTQRYQSLKIGRVLGILHGE